MGDGPMRSTLGPAIRRAVLAGLLAGVLAGVYALVVAEPSLDAAIALEGEGVAAELGAGAGAGFSRTTQKIGLVIGTGLFGAAMGVAFGVAAAWATGRLRGDARLRSLKLGAVAVGALVLLPALLYPPNPPGVGDPEAVGVRSMLYLVVGGLGLLIAALAWWSSRVLSAHGTSSVTARAMVVVGAGVAVAALVAFLPRFGGAGDFPGDLLWSFRLGAVGTQVVLWAGMGVIHGWLSGREHAGAEPWSQTSPAT